MVAGSLRHRVTVQASTETSDGHDGYIVAWANISGRTRISARVEPLQGRELERAQQIDPRVSLGVTLRFWDAYATDLDGGRARLVFHDGVIGDRTLELVAPPIETDQRTALRMLCKESA